MKPRAHKVIPTLLMTAATAVPIVTAIEILNHASAGASNTGLNAGAVPTSTPTASKSTSAASAQPTPSPTAKVVAATPKPTTQTFTGPIVNDQFGGVQATVTVTGNRITDVSITAPQNDPHSAGINSQAVPMLRSETLQAQSANVNTISGATETSDAYLQSLQSAITKARQAGAMK